MTKCLTVDQMTQLLSCNKGLKSKSSGFQSHTYFYKLSNTDIDFIKNQINIDINNDVIVKKSLDKIETVTLINLVEKGTI